MFTLICDIFSLIFAVTGMICLMFVLMFRLMCWRENGVTVILPLRSTSDGIIPRIRHLREIFELLGVHKKCSMAVVNYGAPEWYCELIKGEFDNADFLYIVDAANAAEGLFR